MSVEEILYRTYLENESSLQGLREKRLTDIFERVCYIKASDLRVVNYLREVPLTAFNPGAVLIGDTIYIFPRLIFDYYTYNSSIGVFSLSMEELLNRGFNKPIETRILIYPDKLWEFGHGCEDARVGAIEDEYYILYTGSKHYHENGKLKKLSVQAFARTEPPFREALKLGYLRIRGKDELWTPDCKDSAILKKKDNSLSFLLRLKVKNLLVCWRGELKADDLVIPVDSLKPVFAPEEWEIKVGWSTNAVKLSEDRYIIGWHGVLREDLSYVNGIALLDGNGKLLGISDYLLAPKGLNEFYGDRNGVIFGDGLILRDGNLIWIGGVSDYCMGVFITPLERVMAHLREI